MDYLYDSFWGDSIEHEIAPGQFSRRKGLNRKTVVVEMGRNVCFGKGGGSAPTPDPMIGQAAMKNAQVGEQWLRFAQDQFEVGNERQKGVDALSEEVIRQQMGTQEQTNKWAQEDRERTKSVFQPLQDQFIEEAQNYDSDARQAEVSAQARADVQQAFGQQSDIDRRNMARMGINPNSGRYQEQQRMSGIQAAAASAGAQNAARQQARDRGLAMRADAINMGAGLPSSTAAAYGLGLNAGNSATGNALGAENNWRANTAIMGQGMGGAMQGYSNQANILGSLYGNQLQAWSAQQQANATSAAGVGSLIGTGIGAYAAL